MKVKKGTVVKEIEESIAGDYIAAGWAEVKEIAKKEEKNVIRV